MLRTPICRAQIRAVCLAWLACWSSACASVQSAYLATPVDEQGRLGAEPKMGSGLVISGQELDDYASEYFGMVEVTLQNTSQDWLHIQRLDLDFGSAAKNQAVFLSSGADVEDWYQATLQRNDIRDTNRATALEALVLIGATVAVVGGATRQRGAAAAGSAAALGGTTALVIGQESERIQRAERVRAGPSNHLLALPFAVPPGLFAKKWVLLNTRDPHAPCIDSLLLDYDLEGKGRERAFLVFRSGQDRSEWQHKACAPAADGRMQPR